MCPSSEMFFFEKKMKNKGGLLPSIFSKTTNCLKLTLENRQKSGFYIVKFPNLLRLELACAPHFFDQKFIRMSYLYV